MLTRSYDLPPVSTKWMAGSACALLDPSRRTVAPEPPCRPVTVGAEHPALEPAVHPGPRFAWRFQPVQLRRIQPCSRHRYCDGFVHGCGRDQVADVSATK